MATVWRDVHSRRVDLLRGAAVVYLVVTFVVVILFLSGEDLQVAVPWVDFIVHKLVPVYLVIDWLIDPPSTRLTGRQTMAWLVFPLIWVAVTLVRGAVDGWYPYPFLDPAHGGYASVAVYVVGIFVGFLADRCGDDGGRERPARAPRRRRLDGLRVAGGPIERRIQAPDGRTLAVAEWGDPAGFPIVAIHGTPGSRLGRWRDPSIYARAGVRRITFDRAGYGQSTRRPGPSCRGHRGGRPNDRRRARHRAVRGHWPLRRRPALAGLRRAPARSGHPLRRGRRGRAVRRRRARLVRGPDRGQRPRGRAVARRRGRPARAARRRPADHPRACRQRRGRRPAGGLPAHRDPIASSSARTGSCSTT